MFVIRVEVVSNISIAAAANVNLFESGTGHKKMEQDSMERIERGHALDFEFLEDSMALDGSEEWIRVYDRIVQVANLKNARLGLEWISSTRGPQNCWLLIWLERRRRSEGLLMAVRLSLGSWRRIGQMSAKTLSTTRMSRACRVRIPR